MAVLPNPLVYKSYTVGDSSSTRLYKGAYNLWVQCNRTPGVNRKHPPLLTDTDAKLVNRTNHYLRVLEHRVPTGTSYLQVGVR